MPRLCTALSHGRPCGRRALPGQPFCYGHHPSPHQPQPCAFFNRNGEPCRKLAMRGQDHCFTHSPRNRRTKHAAIPLVPRTPAQLDQAKALLLRKMPLPPAPLSQGPSANSFSFSNMPPSPTTFRQDPDTQGLTLPPEILEALCKALVSNDLPQGGNLFQQPSRNQ